MPLQQYVPAERPEEDPFDKDRMRRSMLIRRFLVFMLDIKRHKLERDVVYHWPPVVDDGPQPRPADIKDWAKWKEKVPAQISAALSGTPFLYKIKKLCINFFQFRQTFTVVLDL